MVLYVPIVHVSLGFCNKYIILQSVALVWMKNHLELDLRQSIPLVVYDYTHAG